MHHAAQESVDSSYPLMQKEYIWKVVGDIQTGNKTKE